MKRIALVSIALLVLASAAFAQIPQEGVIMVYADPTFATCNMTAGAGATITIYVVHETVGATAVQYALEDNSGLIYLADVNMFTLVIGKSSTGVAVSYGGCFSGQVHVQNVLYSTTTPPTACTGITVIPDPLAPSGGIEAVNCSTVKRRPNASFMSFNEDGSCQCGEITPVEETNWGRVKSLYKD